MQVIKVTRIVKSGLLVLFSSLVLNIQAEVFITELTELDTIGVAAYDAAYSDAVNSILPDPQIQSPASVFLSFSANPGCNPETGITSSEATGSIVVTPSESNEPALSLSVVRTICLDIRNLRIYRIFNAIFSSYTQIEATDLSSGENYRLTYATLKDKNSLLNVPENAVAFTEAEATLLENTTLIFLTLPDSGAFAAPILVSEYIEGGPASDVLRAWIDAYTDGDVNNVNRFNRVRDQILKLGTAITEGRLRRAERLLERIENAVENGEERGQVSEATEELIEDLLEDLEDEYLDDDSDDDDDD